MPDSAGPRSHHRHGGGFRNRYSRAAHGPSWELLKFIWQMRTLAVSPPQLPQKRADVAMLNANRTRDTLTWIGHASFLLQLGGLNVLTDPHLTERASPLPFGAPRRFNPPALDFADLPPIDALV